MFVPNLFICMVGGIRRIQEYFAFSYDGGQCYGVRKPGIAQEETQDHPQVATDLRRRGRWYELDFYSQQLNLRETGEGHCTSALSD